MLNRFISFCESQNWDLKTGKTLLAVSGGLDSMVMLELFRQAGYVCHVAHANFGLRGAESDGDEQWVRDYCARHNIPFHSKRMNVPAMKEETGQSTQMAARTLRYQWFAELMKTHGMQHLATAHHAQDNLEHFFLYLMRNSPATALHGIRNTEGQTIRPLRCFPRQELQDFAVSVGLQWREDRSNAHTVYLRNKIRHWIMPDVLDSYPEAMEIFDALSADMDQWMQRQNARLNSKMSRYLQGETLLYTVMNDADGRLIAARWMRSKGLDVREVSKAVACRESGHAFHATAGKIHTTRMGWEYVTADITAEPNPVTLPLHSLPAAIEFGGSTIRFQLAKMDQSVSPDSQTWYFHWDPGLFPLQIRSWETGDRMQPFGMKGHKKLSDILTEARIENYKKAQIPVIESPAGILGLAGIRRSALYPVKSNTEAVLVISWCRTESL
ncbi:MAG: tRNA lysidine(34) synthetase TilS [Bacteroidetes bacterium]|nr:tRNA lysidine(34) synthetase TilS [Bacteroidota bacterium]